MLFLGSRVYVFPNWVKSSIFFCSIPANTKQQSESCKEDLSVWGGPFTLSEQVFYLLNSCLILQAQCNGSGHLAFHWISLTYFISLLSLFFFSTPLHLHQEKQLQKFHDHIPTTRITHITLLYLITVIQQKLAIIWFTRCQRFEHWLSLSLCMSFLVFSCSTYNLQCAFQPTAINLNFE